MDRNVDLLVKILRYIRDNATGEKPLDAPDCRDYSKAEVFYHIGLGIQAGFIDGTVCERDANPQTGYQHRTHSVWGLTWKGHDEVEKYAAC